jgi:hypothetical protein
MTLAVRAAVPGVAALDANSRANFRQSAALGAPARLRFLGMVVDAFFFGRLVFASLRQRHHCPFQELDKERIVTVGLCKASRRSLTVILPA